MTRISSALRTVTSLSPQHTTPCNQQWCTLSLHPACHLTSLAANDITNTGQTSPQLPAKRNGRIERRKKAVHLNVLRYYDTEGDSRDVIWQSSLSCQKASHSRTASHTTGTMEAQRTWRAADRWAMTMQVREVCFIARSRAACTSDSLCASRALVACACQHWLQSQGLPFLDTSIRTPP